jgi:hypothetical protein
MTQPDLDIPLPEMPEGGPEHALRMEGILWQKIQSEIQDAAAEVRADGMKRQVIIRIPGGKKTEPYEVTKEIAAEVERQEWAGHGTNWLQENAQRLLKNTGADLSTIHEDEVAIFHIGIVKPADAQAASKTEERVA